MFADNGEHYDENCSKCYITSYVKALPVLSIPPSLLQSTLHFAVICRYCNLLCCL